MGYPYEGNKIDCSEDASLNIIELFTQRNDNINSDNKKTSKANFELLKVVPNSEFLL